MKYKKIILAIFAVISLVAFTSPAVYAKSIECVNGDTVTARKGDAAPKDKLNEKDYQKACKGHGGYTKSPTGSPPKSSGSSCGGVDTAIISCSEDGKGGNIEDNAIWGLLIMTINILSAGVGILAVGGMIYAAILYATAEDRQDQVNKSKDTMRNVVIGLIAYALMWAGLNFLIPGGLFG